MTDLNVDKLVPPPELVEQWAYMLEDRTDAEAFTAAARWGYKQAIKELETFLEKANDRH